MTPIVKIGDTTITLPKLGSDTDISAYYLGPDTNISAYYSGLNTNSTAYYSGPNTNSTAYYTSATTNDRLDDLEARLNALEIANRLENNWIELKELGDKYRSLLADLIQKEEMWKLLQDNK